MNRPSMRGPRNPSGAGPNQQASRGSQASSGKSSRRWGLNEIEEADYEEIIEEEPEKQRSSGKS